MFFKGRKRQQFLFFCFQIKHRKDEQKRMKKKQTLWNGVSVLIVAVLAITAFIRGDAQFWLNVLAFGVWAIWATVKFLVPYIDQKLAEQEAREIREMYEEEERLMQDNNNPETTGIVLLRHVNHRISAYLKSAYPEATWEWREDYSEDIVSKGGTGRIQVYGVADFNYADVTVNKNAEIKCEMLKIVPMTEIQRKTPTADDDPKPTPQNPVDPQIWYEKKGRVVLENLITDLNSRGHSSLTITANGEVLIEQADCKVKQATLESMPDKMYWTRLSKVFQSEGLATDITEDSMVLSW